jgi:hypothetical protein
MYELFTKSETDSEAKREYMEYIRNNSCHKHSLDLA